VPAFAVIPSPPRPFEAFVEMREMLVMRMQRLHGLAAYRGVHIREEPKLAEGRELLGSLIDKMDACIKNKTDWRKLDAIDIFSPTSLDPQSSPFRSHFSKLVSGLWNRLISWGKSRPLITSSAW
jgi:hypothetical protein